MRRIILLLQYEGTAYKGWQVQDGLPTIQGRLEEALERISNRSIKTVAAGRTDAGVHAAGQVVHFDTASSIPVEKYPIALNTILPKDIRVTASCEGSSDFHARYSALEREYRYYLFPSRTVPPWYRNRCLGTDSPLDISALNGYARQLPGDRDFTTFSAAGDCSRSKIRRLTAASFFMQGPFVVFRISANAFLWRMVRSILGTILDMAARSRPEKDFVTVLESRNRSAAGPTAPPLGLFLHEVRYHEQLFT